MGGILPRYGCCVPAKHNYNYCKENHSSTPKMKGHRRNLSAAFNLSELATDDLSSDQQFLNINTASEEELMTLPGINRQTAGNIVDYRRQISGFKKIEDLALVSGVGATRFNQLRSEICVLRKKGSQSSSASSSRNDLNSSLQDNVSRTSKQSQRIVLLKVNVNTCNVFQLMRVKQLSQDLAQNVVAYRDKRGPFRCLDDLVKVKGIKPALLSAIRPCLVLRDEVVPTPVLYSNGTIPNGGQTCANSLPTSCSKPPGHSRHGSGVTSVSVLNASQEDLISMYGPLLRKSFRQQRKPFVFRRNHQVVVRIGSWNLQQCDNDKASNPGVREVVAMTLLENGVSILAVQEVGGKEVLQQLCDELNRPTIPSVKKWVGHHGTWACVTSETTTGGEQVQDWDVGIVNVQTQSSEASQQTSGVDDLNDVMRSVEDSLSGEHVIVLGAFNADPNSQACLAFRQAAYKNAIHSDVYTNISTKNPEGSCCHDNIWMCPAVQRVHTGNVEVVREGLTSPWIPDGWGWGGVVSGHCPLWTEFYVNKGSGQEKRR